MTDNRCAGCRMLAGSSIFDGSTNFFAMRVQQNIRLQPDLQQFHKLLRGTRAASVAPDGVGFGPAQ